MPRKLKNELETAKAKSKFSMRKRIKKVEDIDKKTTEVKIISKIEEAKGRNASGEIVSIERTTLEFQHAYSSLSDDPKYAKNLFISNYDKIMNSQDFVGIDFIIIQTFIAKNSTMSAEMLANESKNFLKFLWTYLYTKANVEVIPGITFEVIEVAGLLIPVINSGLAGQSITKQTVKLDVPFKEAAKKGIIDGKDRTLLILKLFFETLIESVQFGYIVELNNLFAFRREGGTKKDLALVPGREFFNGQSVMRTTEENPENRGTVKAVKGFTIKNTKE